MMVRKHRLRWVGHVRRMNDNRLPKKMLFGWRVTKKVVDRLKEDYEHINITYSKWTEKAKNRTEWQKLISSLTSDKGK